MVSTKHITFFAIALVSIVSAAPWNQDCDDKNPEHHNQWGQHNDSNGHPDHGDHDGFRNPPENVTTPAPTDTPTVIDINPASTSTSKSIPIDTSDVPTSPAPTGSTGTYMSVVNKWRKANGVPILTNSGQLEANAFKTARDGNGRMQHQLNPGTYGQVLAIGDLNDFERVYVGQWLCEVPSLHGLQGQCGSRTGGGQEGHARILTSLSYSAIGCAWYNQVWACDLGGLIEV